MTIKTRIYDDMVNINKEDVKSFWEKRASLNNLNAVLLGNQKDSSHSDLRNEKELSLLRTLINDFLDISLLDIGCGMGRWANNFKDEIKLYHGIDFSENFISANKKRFEGYNNLKFMVMSASDMDLSLLKDTYDLVIVNGVLMYINDNKLGDVFQTIKKINPRYIYLQESVSVMNERLTLKNFYSEELDTQYNAIYRTKSEYEIYINDYFPNYKFKISDYLLDEKTGAREETNAYYWFLERSNDDRK